MDETEENLKTSPSSSSSSPSGFKQLLNDLSPSDVPLAILIHETIGITYAFGMLFACYKLRPSHQIHQTKVVQEVVMSFSRTFPKFVESMSQRSLRFQTSNFMERVHSVCIILI
jgi:hypothetical protein